MEEKDRTKPTLNGNEYANRIGIEIYSMTSEQVLENESTSSSQVLLVGEYSIGKLLGRGSYGEVREAISCKTLCRRAVKSMKKVDLLKLPFAYVNLLNEVKVLKMSNHVNVVKLYKIIVTNQEIFYLILEYCYCNLQFLIDNTPTHRIPACQGHLYFVQWIEGLEYLHSKYIVHNDIKPSNLLITLDHRIKICDFGTSTIFKPFSDTSTLDNSFGTPAFQPPEVLNYPDKFIGFPKDVWCSGITLCFIMTGKLPFIEDASMTLNEKILYNDPNILFLDPDDDFCDLVNKMLDKDYQNRIKIFQIKLHSWFNKNHMKIPFFLFPGINVHSYGGLNPDMDLERAVFYYRSRSVDFTYEIVDDLEEYLQMNFLNTS